jgi:ADP-heptose:LPS heptosyltransferase
LATLITCPIIVLGGKEEQQEGEKLSAKFPHVINYCGKLSLLQSASVVAQSKFVITHDTGLMHIAAAFKKPIISIWGNTVPEFGMYPYYGKYSVENYKAEISNLNCRPCSKLGHKKCPEGHFKCMEQQDVNAMALFVKENLHLASQ